MYKLFKDVPAQHTEVTGKTLFPMKFCQIRWTQNVAVSKRALEVFDDKCKFVKTAKLPQIISVASIKEASSDPLAKVKIACFVSVAQSLEGFLTTFQSPSPLAPFMYDDLMELVKSLMLRCIKTEIIERLNTASELMKVDLETNLVSIKKVVVAVSVQSFLSISMASDLQIMSFQTSCRTFLVAAIEKVLERSPLKY